MTNEPSCNDATILDYHEGVYVNARRTSGVLEIKFLNSPENFYFEFTGVENINQLQEEYRTAVNIVELAASVARLGYGREDKFSSRALCSSGRT